jgi:hypothetical protein
MVATALPTIVQVGGLAIMGAAKFARQGFAAAGMWVAAGFTPTFAADAPIRRDRALSDRVALFAGGDIARQSYFVWAGIVGSPFGLLHEDGLRLRAVAGGGRYRYHAAAVPGGRNEGTIASGEFMLGFHRNFGAGNVTIYVGGHVEDQRLAAPDPGHDAQGMAAGVKAALEFYYRLGAEFFWTASASASTVHRAYHARAAVGREHGSFAYGIETAVHGDARHVEPRAGLFAQSRYGRTTIQFSGGILSNSENGTSPYATLSLYAPY